MKTGFQNSNPFIGEPDPLTRDDGNRWDTIEEKAIEFDMISFRRMGQKAMDYLSGTIATRPRPAEEK
jgi:hypothetical protein